MLGFLFPSEKNYSTQALREEDSGLKSTSIAVQLKIAYSSFFFNISGVEYKLSRYNLLFNLI